MADWSAGEPQYTDIQWITPQAEASARLSGGSSGYGSTPYLGGTNYCYVLPNYKPKVVHSGGKLDSVRA